MTNPTLIDQARLREALEPLETPTRCYCSQEFGLHHNPACRLSGRVTAENYVSAPGYRRVALTETAASPGSGDGWRPIHEHGGWGNEFLGWQPLASVPQGWTYIFVIDDNSGSGFRLADDIDEVSPQFFRKLPPPPSKEGDE